MEIVELKLLSPKRDAVLLVCCLICAGFLHRWLQSFVIVAGLICCKHLIEAWSWKRRARTTRQTLEERFPALEIVKWEKPFKERRSRGDWGVVHHPVECCDRFSRTVYLNVITDEQTGRVMRMQTRKPSGCIRIFMLSSILKDQDRPSNTVLRGASPRSLSLSY